MKTQQPSHRHDGFAQGLAFPLSAMALTLAGFAGAQTLATEVPAPVEDRSSRTTEAQGQLDIATALATNFLNAQAQKTNPPGVVTQDAIDAQVVDLLKRHADGQGWGALAQSLGFKLGPLVSAAHRADQAEAAGKRREDRQENRQEDRRADRARGGDDQAKSVRSEDSGARGRSSESSRGGSNSSGGGSSSSGGGGGSGGGGRGR